MSTIQTILQKVHIRYEKNNDYPENSTEDFLIRLAYANDGLDEWEKEANEGVQWPNLQKNGSISANGSGLDNLPSDFLSFIKQDEHPSVISDGQSKWYEVGLGKGRRMEQENMTPNVFWVENKQIRTLPAISGTILFPYLRKLTRFETGLETDLIDTDDQFLIEYILGQLYLDDKNYNVAEVHLGKAKEILDRNKYPLIIQPPEESNFGIGM